MREYEDYRAYDFDRLTEGSELKIEHTVYYNNDVDLSDLISKPLAEVLTMRGESVEVETAAYENVRQAAREWEKQAAVTRRIDRALEYIKTPEVQHSNNKWGKDQHGNYDCISNKVYKMYCRIDDYSSWRSDKTRYNVRWHIYTNSPRTNYNVKVAGQERSFTDKASAEKYLQGRIKAYSHLFTEISPPIPKEYEAPFRLHGHLLPGYIVEGEQRKQDAPKSEMTEKKPSIRNQLKRSAEKAAIQPTPEKFKDKCNIEL